MHKGKGFTKIFWDGESPLDSNWILKNLFPPTKYKFDKSAQSTCLIIINDYVEVKVQSCPPITLTEAYPDMYTQVHWSGISESVYGIPSIGFVVNFQDEKK